MKTLKKIAIYTVITGTLAAGLYFGDQYLVVRNGVTYHAPMSTSTPILQIMDTSSDVEKARRQMQEATDKLNAEEAKILAETEAASTTAHAQVAKIMAEYEAVKAEADAKLDEINEIRSSF